MDANNVKLLLSTARDGCSLTQLLNEALLEHDRQVSELRVELARMQGLVRSPALAEGGFTLSPNVYAQERGSSPPEAAPVATPREKEQPASLAHSHWNGAPSGDEVVTDAEESDEDMVFSRSYQNGQSMQKSVTSSNLHWRGHLHQRLWNPVEQASTALILMNTLFLVVQLQFAGYLAGSFLGVTSPGPFHDGSVKLIFDQIEVGFTVVFIIELAVRLARNGCHIFYLNGRWTYVNVLDAVVVLVGGFDSLAAYFFEVSTINVSFCRALRFVRLLRLPCIHDGERFAKLRLLMATIVRSTMSLFWSMFFLWAVMLFSAIFLCQCTAHAYYDETIEESVRLWMFERYGTVARSCYTLFEVTFSGGWPNYARPLVEHVSSLWSVFFVMYITVIVFAVFRIISALFIKETMAVAAEDHSVAVQQAERKRAEFGAKMAALFQEADESGDGQLTLEELEACVKDERFVPILAAMGFTAKECIELFDVIDAGQDGCVSAQEFVHGMVRVKEGVQAQDVMRILGACNLMVMDMHRRQEELTKLLSRQAPQ